MFHSPGLSPFRAVGRQRRYGGGTGKGFQYGISGAVFSYQDYAGVCFFAALFLLPNTH